MAETIAPSPPPAQPQIIPARGSLKLGSSAATLPSSINNLRNCHLTIDTLSPVNQNGSFEFDRVIRRGAIQKRKKKTKSWRTVHIVLRPNLLSIYRDTEESKLRHKIILSDVTAVARQKDPKGKVKHVFAIFSPSRNFHFAARDDKEAQEWVEQIRREARIDEDEEVMSLASPGGARGTYSGFERSGAHTAQRTPADYSSSEAEPMSRSPTMRKPHPAQQMHSARRPSATLEYSGTEHASYSDFSDTGIAAARMSTLSFNATEPQVKLVNTQNQAANAVYGPSLSQQRSGTNPAQASSNELSASLVQMQDAERIVCQGWLYLLKTKSGMRQWKRLWMVLRGKSFAMYKNEDEYSAIRIIPFGNIIDAVEINAISNSKRYCMQIITEDKNFRLCAPDEDVWAQWLGSFKSLLVKRRERLNQESGPA